MRVAAVLAAEASDHASLGDDLITLGVLFVLAYVLGRLARKVGLPAIPVYMVIGLLASPHTKIFPLDFDPANINLIAVFGLVLLLFSLGLEFDQDEFFGNVGKLIISGGSYVAINLGVGIAFGFFVGWGTREALIIAGMTATSSSAIVTKLLIELRRLANTETPMILGVTVVEDIFIAVYLAIISAALSHATGFWPIALRLVIDFLFIVVMFALARWGGKYVSRLLRTNDDELFTVLFFGLAVAFAGIGEDIGVTDAIGAFLIGVVLGATSYHGRIERVTVPLRDVFAAFFFLNFGLGLNVNEFPVVAGVVVLAIVLTMVLNFGASQLIARLNGFGLTEGVNTFVILQNRGEFALILATLAVGAGLDERLTPFAGLYVLVMAVIGPLMAANSERFNTRIRQVAKRRSERRAAQAATGEPESLPSQLVDEVTGTDSPRSQLVDDSTGSNKKRHPLDPAIEAAMRDPEPNPRKRSDDL
ncbi:cation:proton antiporter [Gryllotalpicola reticulitermitis]|uniref:Cation:proton antiporter n=1 Tax=Gryllotalpicola reticulitermitis TaxID=1184153 RepID=A0ABV8Q1W7_9MICO